MKILNIILSTVSLLSATAFAASDVVPQNTEQNAEANADTKIQRPIIKKSTLKTVLPFKTFCGEKIKVIPPNIQLVTEFAQNAAIQSFTYDYKDSDDHFYEIEKCYSKLGWKSFNSAMTRSGNIRAATDEKLFVKAKIDGDVEIIESQTTGTTWKILVPMVVRYENETHYLQQFLKTKLVISIEDKQLKVDQIIASPKLKKHKYEKPIQKFTHLK